MLPPAFHFRLVFRVDPDFDLLCRCIMYSVQSTLVIGRSLQHLRQVNSTNTYLKDLLTAVGDTIPEGLLVIADEQTLGRGRNTNHWMAEPGKNITASILLRPHFLDPMEIFFLNKAIALAVRDTVAQYTGLPVWIKWPNDIYVEGKKVAGLLIENGLNSSGIQFVVAGIGLNVNQTEFGEQLPFAASMAVVARRQLNINEVLETLAAQLEKYYLQLRAGIRQPIDQAYHTWLLWKNEEKKMVTNSIAFLGIIKGVDAAGNLLVETDGKIRSFASVVFIQ